MSKSKQPTKVGYGSPPVATRFQKGQSGNPRGRSKASVALARLVEKSAQERIFVQENGTRKRISKSEAAVKQLFNLAMSGDQRAIKLMADLMNRHSAPPVAATPKFTLTEVDREVLTGMVARARQQQNGDHDDAQ